MEFRTWSRQRYGMLYGIHAGGAGPRNNNKSNL